MYHKLRLNPFFCCLIFWVMLVLGAGTNLPAQTTQEKPNILWLVSEEIRKAVIGMLQAAGELAYTTYDQRAAMGLLDQWGIDASDHEIKAEW